MQCTVGGPSALHQRRRRRSAETRVWELAGPARAQARHIDAARATRWRSALLVLALWSRLMARARASAHDPSASGGLFRTRDARGHVAARQPRQLRERRARARRQPGRSASSAAGNGQRRLALAKWRPRLEIEAPTSWSAPPSRSHSTSTASAHSSRAPRRSSGPTAIAGKRSRPRPARCRRGRSCRARSADGSTWAVWPGSYRSDDWGGSWAVVSRWATGGPGDGIVVDRGRPDEVDVVAGGRFWTSTDAGRSWQRRDLGLPEREVEVVALDPDDLGRLWSIAAGQVFRTDDRGQRWQVLGDPLPDHPVISHGIAVLEPGRSSWRPTVACIAAPTMARDGRSRATISPRTWTAGLLAREPQSPTTMYAGFALTPRR